MFVPPGPRAVTLNAFAGEQREGGASGCQTFREHVMVCNEPFW